jgi:uncharacterized protein (DUF1499 family)
VFAGKRPSTIGVSDGRLAPVKRSPNNVSSQADPSDGLHYVAPIRFSSSAEDAMAALRAIVENTPLAHVVKHEARYLYAEYRSRVFGFVDDVEFLVSEKEGVIHVRSGARLGRRDFGVNRKRIESIRARFTEDQRR